MNSGDPDALARVQQLRLEMVKIAEAREKNQCNVGVEVACESMFYDEEQAKRKWMAKQVIKEANQPWNWFSKDPSTWFQTSAAKRQNSYDRQGQQSGYGQQDQQHAYHQHVQQSGYDQNGQHNTGYAPQNGWGQAAYTNQISTSYVQALSDFHAEQVGSLVFRAGDIIQVTQQGEGGGWWEGSLNGQVGWFPSSLCSAPYTEAQRQ